MMFSNNSMRVTFRFIINNNNNNNNNNNINNNNNSVWLPKVRKTEELPDHCVREREKNNNRMPKEINERR